MSWSFQKRLFALNYSLYYNYEYCRFLSLFIAYYHEAVVLRSV
jgi:hypothetical protein